MLLQLQLAALHRLKESGHLIRCRRSCPLRLRRLLPPVPTQPQDRAHTLKKIRVLEKPLRDPVFHGKALPERCQALAAPQAFERDGKGGGRGEGEAAGGANGPVLCGRLLARSTRSYSTRDFIHLRRIKASDTDQMTAVLELSPQGKAGQGRARARDAEL